MADSDDFLDQTAEVASIFLDLYLPSKPQGTGERAPYSGALAGPPLPTRTVSDHETETSAAEIPESFPRKEVDHEETARIIAERLKIIGDAINDTVSPDLQQLMKEQLGEKSVYQVTLPVFKMMCRDLLSRCSGYFTSGWQQVAAVYLSMTRLVTEIRSAETQSRRERGEPVAAAEAAASPRENQMKVFVGQTLKELHLDRWIEQQGGLAKINLPTTDQPRNVVQIDVPAEGTSVDK